MTINKDNYEAYFLDYFEGNLSPTEIDAQNCSAARLALAIEVIRAATDPIARMTRALKAMSSDFRVFDQVMEDA